MMASESGFITFGENCKLVTTDDIVEFINHGTIPNFDNANDFTVYRCDEFGISSNVLSMSPPANRDIIDAWLNHKEQWSDHITIPLVILPADSKAAINAMYNGCYVVKPSDLEEKILDHMIDAYIPFFQALREINIYGNVWGYDTYGCVPDRGKWVGAHLVQNPEFLQDFETGALTPDDIRPTIGPNIKLVWNTNCSTFVMSEHQYWFNLCVGAAPPEILQWYKDLDPFSIYDDEYVRSHMHEFGFEEVFPLFWVRWNQTATALPNILL